jgi:hypothetical protein
MAQMLVSTANWSSALVWSQCKEHILKQINKRFPKKIKINDNDNNNKKKQKDGITICALTIVMRQN